MKRFDLVDALIFGGIAMMGFGFFKISPPLGLISSGFLLFSLGVFLISRR